jgi:hypothetical protein
MIKYIWGMFAGLAFVSSSFATVISSDDYSLTAASEFGLGSTGWNMQSTAGYTSDLTLIEGLLSDGYVDDFSKSVVNGIYYGFPSEGSTSILEFSMDGGVDTQLGELSFLSSRAYADGNTVITLEYQLNGGGWITGASGTAAQLGMYPGLEENLSPAQEFKLGFGGIVTADQFRMTFAGTSQVSLHEVQVSSVPVPAAVWLFGSALAGLGWVRRKQIV